MLRKRVTYAAFALVLGFLVTGSAHATVLFAGPLNSDATFRFLDCAVSNVGTRNPLSILVEAIDRNGGVIGSQTFNLGPFQSDVLLPGALDPNGPGICRYTFTANKNQVRATACLSTNGRCDGAAVPAVELPDAPR